MSNSFSSKISAIDNLWFDPIPAKPIAVTRAARVGKTTVFIDNKGGIYSTSLQNRVHYTLTSNSTAIEETFAACVKLGLLGKDAVAQHKKHGEEVRAKRDREWVATVIEEQAKKIGLILTPEQKAKVAAVKKGGSQ